MKGFPLEQLYLCLLKLPDLILEYSETKEETLETTLRQDSIQVVLFFVC